MNAILFALIAMVAWAVGDVINTYASRDVGGRTAFFWWLICSFIFSSLYIPFAGPITDWYMFLGAIALNLFASSGTMLFFRALEIGNVSLVGAISGSFPLVSVLLSMAVYGETMTVFQVVGFLLIMTGLILASINPQVWKQRHPKHLVSDPGVILALIVFFIWGVYFALVRTPIETIGWFWAGYSGNLFFLVLLLSGRVKKTTLSTVFGKRVLMVIAAAALFSQSANFSYNLGLTVGFTSIVAPIAGSYPVLFVLLSRFFFLDRLSRMQAIGTGLSLVGIVLIGLVT